MTDTEQTDQSRRVLYFEDDPLDAQIMQMVCGTIPGVDLVIATDAQLGFQLVKAHDFSLILMDIMLPDMSGFDVTTALRTAPQTKDIPIIAVSGNEAPSEYEKPGDLGFAAYVTKPIDAERMAKLLRSALGMDD